MTQQGSQELSLCLSMPCVCPLASSALPALHAAGGTEVEPQLLAQSCQPACIPFCNAHCWQWPAH